MRTLAATFGTRNEAEAASRRLEAIGISHDRIILKDVAAPAASAGAADGVFISVKVTTEQVQPVSQILKETATAGDSGAVAPNSGGEANLQGAMEQSELPPRVRPSPASDMQPRPLPTEGNTQPPRAPGAQLAAEKARFRTYFIYYGFALLAAFMIGAWLGMAG